MRCGANFKRLIWTNRAYLVRPESGRKIGGWKRRKRRGIVTELGRREYKRLEWRQERIKFILASYVIREFQVNKLNIRAASNQTLNYECRSYVGRS